MAKKNKKSNSNTAGEKRQKTAAAAKQKQQAAPAAEPPASNGAHKPKYALMGSDGKQSTSTVARVFSTLEYGPAPESPAAANAWLDSHGRDFGHFINNEWYKPAGERRHYQTTAPATGEVLSSTTEGTAEDVDVAVQAAKRAQVKWAALPPHARARHMYSLARHVQKHARLIAVVEALDNGKTVRETRDADVPIVARWLYHYAGWAQLAPKEMQGWKPVGVIGGIVPWNFPLMLTTWKVAPALAMGNTVVLKPATPTRLSALLFAEICAEAGLPPGVFNVVTGGGRMGSSLAEHPDVDKVAFTGSTGIGALLRRNLAGTGKKISLELGGKSPVCVFESADLDSVVEGVVNAVWFNQGQVCSAGSRLLVQEPIYKKLVGKLKARMKTLRLGHSLDKCIDMGPLVQLSHWKDVSHHVQTARDEGAEVYQACNGAANPPNLPEGELFFPPTLVLNVESTSTIVQEEVFGPVLAVQTFRTPKEAISLANNTRYGLGASVWTEKMTLAMEVALGIKAGTVWINGHNMFDAASGFGGFRESGFGRDGGREGLYEYVKPAWMERARPEYPENDPGVKGFGTMTPVAPTLPTMLPGPAPGTPGGTTNTAVTHMPPIDRTLKMFYGGKQKRPDATYCRPVLAEGSGTLLGQVSEGNRKDIRNAVECAYKAAPGWGKRAAHNRAQIVYYIAENLELRFDEIAGRIAAQTGRTIESANAEVSASINRLFYWAAYADKYGGEVQETSFYGATVKINEPVGTIGIACPDEYPLLGFVSLFAPAVVRGNTIIIVPSEAYPLSATDLYQVFETSDVPAGVVNIITGNRNHLTKYLVEHQNIEAMWYFGDAEGSRFVEHASAGNMKRSWVNYGCKRDWMVDEQGQGVEFLYNSTECKNIWMPMGVIFDAGMGGY
jgi:aldehyde dehydrogenase (NAD+)|eukprot:g5550.t1